MEKRIRHLVVLALLVSTTGLLLSLAPALEVRAATPIYVRPDGDDANCDGTVNAPYPGGGPGLACAVRTIQRGVDMVDSGGTVYVAPGTYTENVNVNKRITLQGAGSGADPDSATIVEAASAEDPVLQIQASGTSASDRLTIRALRVTGATTAVGGNPGSGIEFDGTRSFVAIENVASVGNEGHGIAIDATGDMQGILVLDSTLSSNGGSGFRVPSSLNSLRGLVITGSQIADNISIGLIVYGSGERDVSVSDTLFSGNATNLNTGGDIVLTSFIAGTASFTNVTITSDNADAAIRITGSSSSPAVVPPIALADVTVTGTQRGAALAISRYTDGSNVSLSNVTLNSTAPSGVHLGSMSGALDTGNTGFGGSYSAPGFTPSFSVPNPGAIVLGKHRGVSGSDATISVDATYNDWGITNLAAIEDRIYHQVDSSALGKVLYYDITLGDDGSSPMADGGSYAVITATLTGLLHPAGNAISLTTDLGTLGAFTGTADAGGVVTTIITSTASGVATITGTAGMAGANLRSDTTQVVFGSLTLDHFSVNWIPDQVVGVSFPVIISARDASDAIIDFDGWATLTDTTTTLVSTNPIQFHSGTWSGTVVVTQVYAGDVISVTYVQDAGRYGTSNAFDVNPPQYSVHLPAVFKNYAHAPDLVIDRVIAIGDSVQVIIRNQGSAFVVDGFWVDVYVNPTPIPFAANQTWDQLSIEGLVWGVTADALPLLPGSVLTLTNDVGDAYYYPGLSNLSVLTPGTLVYGQVDSANALTNYGAVLENHEISGGVYNNVTGPVLSMLGVLGKENTSPAWLYDGKEKP